MRLCLLVLALSACGASAKQISGPHLDPHDDVGDVVTGSPTAPQSPGLNGPSVPGGTGAGGGTPRPR